MPPLPSKSSRRYDPTVVPGVNGIRDGRIILRGPWRDVRRPAPRGLTKTGADRHAHHRTDPGSARTREERLVPANRLFCNAVRFAGGAPQMEPRVGQRTFRREVRFPQGFIYVKP